jgi:hypothetical protein
MPKERDFFFFFFNKIDFFNFLFGVYLDIDI